MKGYLTVKNMTKVIFVEMFILTQLYISGGSIFTEIDNSFRRARGITQESLVSQIPILAEADFIGMLEDIGIPTRGEDVDVNYDFQTDTEGNVTQATVTVEGRTYVMDIDEANGSIFIQGPSVQARVNYTERGIRIETVKNIGGDNITEIMDIDQEHNVRLVTEQENGARVECIRNGEDVRLISSKDGQIVIVDSEGNETAVSQVGEDTVMRIRYQNLPELATEEDVMLYAGDNENMYGLDQMSDVDSVSLIQANDGTYYSVLFYYDENTQDMHGVVFQGRDTYDQVHDSSNQFAALDELIAFSAAGGAGGVVSRFVDKDYRGQWLHRITKVIAGLAAAGTMASIADFSYFFSSVSGFVIGGITALALYNMYKTITKYGAKSMTGAFLHAKEIESQFGDMSDPVFRNVMENGLPRPLMVIYPMFSNPKTIEELREHVEITIREGIEADKTNGNFYVGFASNTRSPEMRLAEIQIIKDMQEKYGDKVKMVYFARNPQQDIQWKEGIAGDIMALLTNGCYHPSFYIDAERYGSQARDPNGIVFLGDSDVAKMAVEQGILTQAEADQFVQYGIVGDMEDLGIPDVPGNMDGKIQDFWVMDHDTSFQRNEILLGEAQVAYAEAYMLDENGERVYDMFTPDLTVYNPDGSHLLRFQDLGQRMFRNVEYADAWYFNSLQSVGKGRIYGKVFLEKMLSPGNEQIDLNMTSHDQWDSFIMQAGKLFGVTVNDGRQATMQDLARDLFRFSYGDWTTWAQKRLPMTAPGKFIRQAMGLAPVPQADTASRREIIQNPVDFVFSDINFASYLGLTTLAGYLPGVLDLQHPAVALGIAGTMVLGGLIAGPLFVSPIAREMQNRGLISGLKDSISGRDLAEALSQLREMSSVVGNGVKEGFMAWTQSMLYMMPMVVLKPYMALKIWTKHKLVKEAIGGNPTDFAKPLNIALSWENLNKSPVDVLVSNALVPLLGAGFGASLWATSGFVGLGIGLPIYATMMMWPWTVNKLLEK